MERWYNYDEKLDLLFDARVTTPAENKEKKQSIITVGRNDFKAIHNTQIQRAWTC